MRFGRELAFAGATVGMSMLASACFDEDPTATPLPSDTAVVSTVVSTVPETTSAPPEATTSTPASTTTIAEIAGSCIYTVLEGDTLGSITEQIRSGGIVLDDESTPLEEYSFQQIAEENAIDPNILAPGDLLDICINGENDINLGDALPTTTTTTTTSTTSTTTTTTAPKQPRLHESVSGIQEATNNFLGQIKSEHFQDPFDLSVDGVYGDFTRRATCMARLLMGLEPTRAKIKPGSDIAKQLANAKQVLLPEEVRNIDGKWSYTSITCQTTLFGVGPFAVGLVESSTGEAGLTRQYNKFAYAYNPATENDGWHTSSLFPLPEDSILLGNMYRPIYIDRGIAIHGGNTVSIEPGSKGCVRLQPTDQDDLIAFVELTTVNERITGAENVIGLFAVARGDFEYDIAF